MIFFGVLGEYAGRTYLLVSRKPQTAIREVLRGDARGRVVKRRARELTEEVSVGRRSDL